MADGAPKSLFSSQKDPLVDPFGRAITYLRLSITDRCDLRCTYCMPERMTFLPRKDVLSFEEVVRLVGVFVDQGVRRLRLTGGEPLVRRDVDRLLLELGEFVSPGKLDELTLTTNGVALARFADTLAKAGIRRINVSLDTLRPDVFERITRRHRLAEVLDGIEAAQAAGLKVKINTVVLKSENAGDIPAIVEWAHKSSMDISLIEVMPMGDVDEDRRDQFYPLTEVRQGLETRWKLTPDTYRTGGPSRYHRIEETGGRIGFISPLTENFCSGCNRIRLTCTGKLYMCLGQGNETDFRAALRAGASKSDLSEILREAITRKPLGHDFEISDRRHGPAVDRAMSVTGG
ncbi:MAG: GTP 3',8-cyclase MoaA [Pseudomonadota bacterium]